MTSLKARQDAIAQNSTPRPSGTSRPPTCNARLRHSCEFLGLLAPRSVSGRTGRSGGPSVLVSSCLVDLVYPAMGLKFGTALYTVGRVCCGPIASRLLFYSTPNANKALTSRKAPQCGNCFFAFSFSLWLLVVCVTPFPIGAARVVRGKPRTQLTSRKASL